MKAQLFFLAVLSCVSLTAMYKDPVSYSFYKPADHKVLVHHQDQKQCLYVLEALQKFGIPYQETAAITPEDPHNLYLVFDLEAIPAQDLPHHYIAFQCLNLTKNEPNQDYLDKLSGAVVVWDYDWGNINCYKSTITHYYYFPENYEYVDPIILSCLLPTRCLAGYKEIVMYSNIFNSDISSHLPTLFIHTVLQQPELLIEAGIRGAESTIAFKKAVDTHTTIMVGLDIEKDSAQYYSAIPNAMFFCMNDLEFPHYYKSHTALNKKSADMIFIDTSHHYEHTFGEIKNFAEILSDRGMLFFHDSHMSPLNNLHSWYCINGDLFGVGGWDNQKGVARAIKDYFTITFDETSYNNFIFKKNDTSWHLLHYPFCNGLTIIRKMQ